MPIRDIGLHAYIYGRFAMFPKPKDIKHEPVTVRVYRDGREACNLITAAGRAEYKRRRAIAFCDQNGICTICHKSMLWEQATTDHIKPRGMGAGKRDDRQENLAAVHGWCNSEKGSRRI